LNLIGRAALLRRLVFKTAEQQLRPTNKKNAPTFIGAFCFSNLFQ
jgi:5-formaminoimidazole-4-carboxamide-1-beta-D-ribofuranosyl 5'-monophosphate synthetase